MTTSKKTLKRNYKEAYVWIWLPNETKPVVAGKLTIDGDILIFNYGKSYLERPDKIAIYDRELPLQTGAIAPLEGLRMAGSIRDGAPDAWGRRVLVNKLIGKTGGEIDSVELSEMTYLLESGSDRIGALDFQLSATEYIPRSVENSTLDELLKSAEKVEQGIPLSADLDLALHHGSPIGGARPKALIEDENKKYIAKFSSSSDVYSVIKAEFIAMTLAKIVGIEVAPVKLAKSSHKDVLLVERFDRVKIPGGGWKRKSVVSALTMFELDEMMFRYASYEKLAEIVRVKFKNSSVTLKQLYQRLVFNILVGNTDDHARNHAAFWDGEKLSLTPAYDICPQARSGQLANQGMLIVGDEKRSQLSLCLEAAPQFHLKRAMAIELIKNQIEQITENWESVCTLAEVNPVDKKLFENHQFLNSYAFEDLPDDALFFKDLRRSFVDNRGP